MVLISDPPAVTITSTCSGVVNTSDDCSLTCTPSGGNPQNYSYEWQFRPKFDGSFEVLLEATSAEFVVQSAMDSDAGTYGCRVTNAGGVSSAALDINVNC